MEQFLLGILFALLVEFGKSLLKADMGNVRKFQYVLVFVSEFSIFLTFFGTSFILIELWASLAVQSDGRMIIASILFPSASVALIGLFSYIVIKGLGRIIELEKQDPNTLRV